MSYKHNPKLTENAKKLRKNMTPQERHLWYDFLRDYQPRFLRQKVIDNYICDFYCSKAKLVVEIDGAQHYEETKTINDNERTKHLQKHGLRVIRFSNYDINVDFENVCEYIDSVVKQRIGMDD